VLVAAAALLSGCTGTTGPSPTHSPTATPHSNSLGVTCSELVPQDVVDGLHRNMVLQPGFAPQPGTYPAKIVSLGGLSCEWLAKDGYSLVASAAKPSAAQLAANEAKVSGSSTSTVVFGQAPAIRGYYANTGGTFSGDLEVFTEDGYWLSAVSVTFETPGDAASVIAAMLQSLPSD
jgi:hypothetical protein